MKPGNVGKDNSYKIYELNESLLLIRDACARCRAGDLWYHRVISSQLRSLLLDRSRSAHALLFYVCEMINYNPILYVVPINDETFPDDEDGLTSITMDNHKASLFATHENHVQTTLKHYLSMNVCRAGNNSFTLQTIIEWFANELGGSHYSKTMSPVALNLISFDQFHSPGFQAFLVQFAELVVKVGYQVLSAYSDHDVMAVFAIKRNEGKELVILDAIDPVTSIRTTLRVNEQGLLTCRMGGIFHRTASISSETPLQDTVVVSVMISLRITPSLRATLKMTIDGIDSGFQIIDGPLLSSGRWTGFEVAFNKHCIVDPQDSGSLYLSFCQAVPVYRERSYSNVEAYRSYWGATGEVGLLFPTGQYGLKGPSAELRVSHGSVRHVNLEEFMREQS